MFGVRRKAVVDAEEESPVLLDGYVELKPLWPSDDEPSDDESDEDAAESLPTMALPEQHIVAPAPRIVTNISHPSPAPGPHVELPQAIAFDNNAPEPLPIQSSSEVRPDVAAATQITTENSATTVIHDATATVRIARVDRRTERIARSLPQPVERARTKEPELHKEATNAPEILKAGQRYIEQYGAPMVMNSYLKVAVLVLCFAMICTVGVVALMARSLAHKQPMFVRIDEVGHAEAVNYKDFAYKPKEAENKYYLTKWTELYFQRNKFTIEKDQTQALFFLNSDVSRVVITQEQKDKYIPKYQSDGSLPYVEIEVTNIILGDLTKAPYAAQIEFLKKYMDASSGSEVKRERWTLSLNYTFRESVPNDMVAVNPLGLTIMHFRVDQAFSVQPTTEPGRIQTSGGQQ
jgi:type IV secretion system protein VirB5